MSKNYKSIEKEEAAANELWRKTYEPEAAEDETEKEEFKAAEVQEPAPSEVIKDGIQEKEVTPEPEKEPEVPKKVEAEPEKDYKQMYKTLEGKYRAEVPELHKNVKHWKDNAIQLSDKILELEKKISDIESSSSRSEIKGDLDALEAEYPDIGKTIRKIEERHASELAARDTYWQTQLNKSLAPMQADLNMTRESRFDADMVRFGVPNWREINIDPEFIDYLNAPAPYGRKTKLELLQEAGSTLDAEVASKFFLEYMNTKTPAGKPVDGQEKLKKYVAPPKAETGANSKGGSGKPELTIAMYEKFYKETSKPGRYNPKNWFGKTEAEMEAMLEAALVKGELKR